MPGKKKKVSKRIILRKKIKQIKTEYIILSIILLLNFLIRWYNINNLSGLEEDEISWAVTSLFDQFNIPSYKVGVWSLIYGLSKTFPVSIKLNQLSFILFGYDLLSPKKLLVFINIIILFCFYVFLRIFFKKATSLFVLILYSFSYFKLTTSMIAIQPAFIELFLYPSLIFFSHTLNPKEQSSKKTILFSILASIFLLLTIFTYNLAFSMPFIFILLFLFQAKINKKRRKIILISLGIFLIPFLILSPVLYRSVKKEFLGKSYAFKKSVISISDKQLTINLGNFTKNSTEIFKLMFFKMNKKTSDMLVNTKSSLIDPFIALLFITGLLIGLKNYKKYFLFISWLLLGALPYHLIQGLYLPRMWLVSYPLFYLFAAITIEHSFIILLKKSQLKKIILTLCFILIFIIYSLYHFLVLKTQAYKNPAYKDKYKELAEISKNHGSSLVIDTWFITTDSTTSFTQMIVSFYYLSSDLSHSQEFNAIDKNKLGVLTFNDLKKRKSITKKKIVIIESEISSEVKKQLKLKGIDLQKNQEFEYFNEYQLINE